MRRRSAVRSEGRDGFERRAASEISRGDVVRERPKEHPCILWWSACRCAAGMLRTVEGVTESDGGDMQRVVAHEPVRARTNPSRRYWGIRRDEGGHRVIWSRERLDQRGEIPLG